MVQKNWKKNNVSCHVHSIWNSKVSVHYKGFSEHLHPHLCTFCPWLPLSYNNRVVTMIKWSTKLKVVLTGPSQKKLADPQHYSKHPHSAGRELRHKDMPGLRSRHQPEVAMRPQWLLFFSRHHHAKDGTQKLLSLSEQWLLGPFMCLSAPHLQA